MLGMSSIQRKAAMEEWAEGKQQRMVGNCELREVVTGHVSNAEHQVWAWATSRHLCRLPYGSREFLSLEEVVLHRQLK